MIPPCLALSNIRYVLRIKWSNPWKGVASSPTPQCSSYWKGSLWLPSTTVANFTLFIVTFSLINKYINKQIKMKKVNLLKRFQLMKVLRVLLKKFKMHKDTVAERISNYCLAREYFDCFGPELIFSTNENISCHSALVTTPGSYKKAR